MNCSFFAVKISQLRLVINHWVNHTIVLRLLETFKQKNKDPDKKHTPKQTRNIHTNRQQTDIHTCN